MAANNNVDAEMSIDRDVMKNWEIIKFEILSALCFISILCIFCLIYLIIRYKCVRNKVNGILVNLCIIIFVHLSFNIGYQYICGNDAIYTEKFMIIVNLIYFGSYMIYINTLVMLSTFWISFILFKDLFYRFESIIYIGWIFPYVPSSIPILLFVNNVGLEKFYYYFIVSYLLSLLLVLIVMIYFLLMKLAERIKKNKLDYLLYLSVSSCYSYS
ncbi:hypothetical protein HHI36_008189 [Cryptolaemus montrouzieri]|uniref:Uncharacterized protein n=1 Tax=Cryptolaemus montrouzieri TaxID=559131 RepID=A0ABD2MSB6_9CUCU